MNPTTTERAINHGEGFLLKLFGVDIGRKALLSILIGISMIYCGI